MNERAKQFYDRARNTQDYNEKLLCLNNAFFCLYSNDFSLNAATVCGVSEKVFLDAVEYCREDSESPRVVLEPEQIAKLNEHLANIFK